MQSNKNNARILPTHMLCSRPNLMDWQWRGSNPINEASVVMQCRNVAMLVGWWQHWKSFPRSLFPPSSTKYPPNHEPQLSFFSITNLCFASIKYYFFYAISYTYKRLKIKNTNLRRFCMYAHKIIILSILFLFFLFLFESIRLIAFCLFLIDTNINVMFVVD